MTVHFTFQLIRESWLAATTSIGKADKHYSALGDHKVVPSENLSDFIESQLQLACTVGLTPSPLIFNREHAPLF